MSVPKCQVYERGDPKRGELLEAFVALFSQHLAISWAFILKAIGLSICHLGEKSNRIL